MLCLEPSATRRRDDGQWHEAKINIAEQQWSLLFKSIPAYIKLHRQWQSWVILLFGFTITTVLSLYIFSGFRRADKIEAKVLERTAELSKAMDAMREANEIQRESNRIQLESTIRTNAIGEPDLP